MVMGASGAAMVTDFPVNLQNWDYSVGATPSPMRAAIANGALSLVGSLMSPAPGSAYGIRGTRSFAQKGGPGFGQKLDFALDPDYARSDGRDGDRSHMMSGNKNSNRFKKGQKKSMRFKLQPNGGLSLGLHPMGDFFDGSESGDSPPHDMFDPLSEGTSPRTWARSPGSDGGDRRHVIHHGQRHKSKCCNMSS